MSASCCTNLSPTVGINWHTVVSPDYQQQISPNDKQMSNVQCPNVQMTSKCPNDIQIGQLPNNLPAIMASTIQSSSQHTNSKPAISGQCEQANKPYYPQHTFLPYRAITGWAVSTMPCLGKQSLRKMRDFLIWENLSLINE